jgi:hypothetical protein
VRNPARERSRNPNREVWESPSVYGGEDVNISELMPFSICRGVITGLESPLGFVRIKTSHKYLQSLDLNKDALS